MASASASDRPPSPPGNRSFAGNSGIVKWRPSGFRDLFIRLKFGRQHSASENGQVVSFAFEFRHKFFQHVDGTRKFDTQLFCDGDHDCGELTVTAVEARHAHGPRAGRRAGRPDPDPGAGPCRDGDVRPGGGRPLRSRDHGRRRHNRLADGRGAQTVEHSRASRLLPGSPWDRNSCRQRARTLARYERECACGACVPTATRNHRSRAH
jgi:hypothetical protein